ncbi:MAG: hypothetical protein NTW87_23520 [Planctomycetota bacterium]|nr:hypothetical protein [Planctomycetota bacterium]
MDPVPARALQAARDALLIQGLAILCAAATASLAAFSGIRGQLPVFLGVGLAAMVTLGCWSAVLAVRAVRGPGAPVWPALIVLLVLAEASGAAIMFFTRAAEAIGGGYFWEWAATTGLLLFAAVFLLAGLLAVPVAWWRVRRAAKRDAASGAAARGCSRRLRRAVLWYVGAAVFLVAILLPCPLFVFCAYSPDRYSEGERERLERIWHWRWRTWVVKHTPVAIGEVSAWLLSCSSKPIVVECYERVLMTGRVSKARLIGEITGPKPRLNALYGLNEADRAAATDMAVRIGKGEVARGAFDWHAGYLLGDYGTPEQIRLFLSPELSARNPRFFDALAVRAALRGLEFVPDLVRLAEVKPISPRIRTGLLYALARAASKEDTWRLWAGFFADPDYGLRQEAMKTAANIRPVNRRARVILPVLESDSDRLHFNVYTYGTVQSVADEASALKPELRIRMVKSLLRLLDQRLDGTRDLDSRREAAWSLARFTDAPPDLERTSHSLTEVTERTNGPIRATPDDARVVKELKEHAERWLQEKR